MGDKSAIEWTDASWSPIRARYWESQNDGSGKERIGWHCEHVSEGCRNCYAERMNLRLGTGRDFKPGELYRAEHEGYNNGNVKLFLDETMLTAPLRWKTPRMIFVCSMTDLFADFVPDAWIDKVFAVMALCPQHTFQVLTKRSKRMREYMTTPVSGPWAGRMRRIDADGRESDATDAWRRVHAALVDLLPTAGAKQLNLAAAMQEPHGDGFMPRYPLPNVWLGVSAEDQARADERILDLLATPAAVRFGSAEPLLAEIDFEQWLHDSTCEMANIPKDYEGRICTCCEPREVHLDWIITGGESGSGARITPRGAFQSIRDQCAAAGTAYFHKQNGEWLDADQALDQMSVGQFTRHGKPWNPARPLNFEDAVTVATACRAPFEHHSDGTTWLRLGKARAGRLLAGRTHDAFPTTNPSSKGEKHGN